MFEKIAMLASSVIDARPFGLFIVQYSDLNTPEDASQIASFDTLHELEDAAQSMSVLLQLPIARDDQCRVHLN